MPLPPYIRRPEQPGDRERYQTVYARDEGSVAAPTAGLHFSPELLAALDQAGLERCAVTLHVGPGTFTPVRSELVEEHRMEAERYRVPEATALAVARARTEGRRVVAVGTTAVRTLEASGGHAGEGRTDLFIRPGYRFGVVDALLTNFHLPRSTLLMLVCAFAGKELILEAYRAAVETHYRFYSYGDAMLIL
jgi:S-adenosylmethionine:tRNA ribosyltransferase-isomerase